MSLLERFDPDTIDQLEQRLEDRTKRLAAKRSLVEWCRWCGFEPARHHKFILEHLEEMAKPGSKLDRLAIFCPPGAGKSIYSSILFTAWYLGQNPSAAVIAASHTAELAEKWGRRVRNLIVEHADVLGVNLAPDSQAAGRWETDKKGEYYAAGVGGAIAGRRADLVVLDDVVRSREDADSDIVQARTWDWYKSDLYTRLKPGGKIVLIMTRWSEGDLAGLVLDEMTRGGDKWAIISLPAIAEEDDQLGRKPGQALWPEWQSLQELERIRRAVGPRDWSALYQQRPSPETGNYFQAEWLRPYTEAPPLEQLHIYGASDYAVTDKGGDFTVHCIIGIDAEERIYLLEMWREQAASDKWVEALCDLVDEYKPIGWAEEQGQIKGSVGPFLRKRMMERRSFVATRQFPTKGDKAIRAQSIRGRMAMRGLYVPIHKPWYPAFRNELLAFPAGRHDDICVADGTLVRMADGSDKPIELVNVGDKVATPIGPQSVEVSQITNESAEVWRVTFSNGAMLTATPNHPVYIQGKGFVRVDALCLNDQCAEAPQQQKSLSIADIGTVDTQMGQTRLTSAISLEQTPSAGFFTGISGRTISGPYLKGVKFTIAIVTRQITKLKIWNVTLRKNTAHVIQWLENTWSVSWLTWRKLDHLLLGGMGRRLVANGIAKMGSWLGIIASQPLKYVYAVKPNSTLILNVPSFALVYARRDLGSVVQTKITQIAKLGEDTLRKWKGFNAFVATDYFSRIGPKPLNIAPRPAVCVTGIKVLSERMRVRNLAVRNVHTYYTNGILSHNCDALGLCGQILDVMSPGEKPKENVKPKILSVDPAQCTVTLNDIWDANERGRAKLSGRI